MEKNHVDAAINLGVLCRDGVATPVDRAAAIQWFEKAAAFGHQDGLVEANALRVNP